MPRSRKPAKKSPRKPAKKSPRKPAKKTPRKPAKKTDRKPAKKSPRKPSKKSSRKLRKNIEYKDFREEPETSRKYTMTYQKPVINRVFEIDKNEKIVDQSNNLIAIPIINKPKIISGLQRFEILYSKKYDKIVYLLGEVHDKTKCADSGNTADNLFLDLVETAQNKGAFLDIFLELDYNPTAKLKDKFFQSIEILPIDYENTQSYMVESIIKLAKAGCLDTYHIENCKLNNIRIHSTDIRKTDNVIMNFMSDIAQYVMYCLSKNKETCNETYDRIIKYERNKNVEQLRTDIMNALKDSKILKQIDNIPDKYSEIKNYLNNTFKNSLDKDLPHLLNVASTLKKYKKLSGEGSAIPLDKLSRLNNEEIKKFKNFLEQIKRLSLIEDIDKLKNYLNMNEKIFPMNIKFWEFMGKVNEFVMKRYSFTNPTPYGENEKQQLKEYIDELIKSSSSLDFDNMVNLDELNLFRNQSTDLFSRLMDLYLSARIFRSFRNISGKYSAEPKNIIIYAGDFHSGNYSKMFKDIGFEILFSSTNKLNCLDLTGLDNLLFYKTHI